MHTTRLTACALCCCLIFGLHTISAQEAAVNQAQGDKTKKSKEQELLKSFVGTWEGTVRTWLRPGELADESTIKTWRTFLRTLDADSNRSASASIPPSSSMACCT